MHNAASTWPERRDLKFISAGVGIDIDGGNAVPGPSSPTRLLYLPKGLPGVTRRSEGRSPARIFQPRLCCVDSTNVLPGRKNIYASVNDAVSKVLQSTLPIV